MVEHSNGPAGIGHGLFLLEIISKMPLSIGITGVRSMADFVKGIRVPPIARNSSPPRPFFGFFSRSVVELINDNKFLTFMSYIVLQEFDILKFISTLGKNITIL